jgi:hypothetical protein
LLSEERGKIGEKKIGGDEYKCREKSKVVLFSFRFVYFSIHRKRELYIIRMFKPTFVLATEYTKKANILRE